ncbi:MAG: hypothetical protein U5Q44_11395 [Dehalococcoidia bacterium]|nr:hypothetical protein [Dehalococcoidia bacterium]
MHILANTVKELPPIRWSDFVVEAWLNVHRVPMTLVESPTVELPGNPPCAYASEHGVGGSETGRLWMWLGAAPEPGADREVHLQVIEEVPAESH